MKYKLLLIALLLFAYPSQKVQAAFPIKDNRIEVIAQKQPDKSTHKTKKIRGFWFLLAAVACFSLEIIITAHQPVISYAPDMGIVVLSFLLIIAAIIFLFIAISKAFN